MMMTPASRIRDSRGGILFLTWELDVGGFQVHWRDLIVELTRRDRRCRLICMGPYGATGDRLRSDGFDVHAMDPAPNRWPLKAPHVLRLIREFKPDAIVSNSTHQMWFGALVGRIMGIPSFVNWHAPPGQYSSFGWATGNRAAARLGSSIICVSRSQVQELSRWGYPLERIHVISNGVAEPRYSLDQPAGLRSDLGLPGDRPIAVSVARLAPEKRVDRFVRAIAAIEDSGVDLAGVIVGDGPCRRGLERLIIETGANVRMVGFDEDPSRWVRAADVACLTSEFEAEPLALLEGMACGKPFVAMETGGVPDLARGGSVGTVVPQGDQGAFEAALGELASDADRRRAMGVAARRSWETSFTHSEMVDHYEKILLGEPPEGIGDTK